MHIQAYVGLKGPGSRLISIVEAPCDQYARLLGLCSPALMIYGSAG